MSKMQALSLHQKTKKNFKNERVMAITEENIRGKIGNSIFYRVGSVTRVRSAASKYTDANTSKQRPFPLEGGDTFLPTFGRDGITGSVVSGSKGNGEKWV